VDKDCTFRHLLADNFHPKRIDLAKAPRLDPKRDGDTKRVIRRLNSKKVRLSAPDQAPPITPESSSGY
jgi:hypothetical protein